MSRDRSPEIAARASSGRALRGINYIPFTKQQNEPIVGQHFLIDLPSDLEIMGTDQTARYTKFYFSGIHESQSFCKDVKEKGWAIAMSIHANYMLWDGSVDVSVAANKNKNNFNSSHTKMWEACITECVYIPMTSFQISTDTKVVKLSQHALTRAQGIKTDSDADKFLKEFHPFVFSSKYQLGGAFFRQTSVKCNELATISQILEEIESQKSGSTKLGVKLGLPEIGAKLGVSSDALGSFKDLNDHRSSKQHSRYIQQIQEELIVCGPTTAKTADELYNMLESDPSSWAIIDSNIPTSNTLLSIWDLLLEHSNVASSKEDAIALKNAAKLLCCRWKINASSQVSDDLELRILIDDAEKFLIKSSQSTLMSPSTEPPPLPDHPVYFSNVDNILEYLHTLPKQFNTSSKPNMEEAMKRIKDFNKDHEFSNDREHREASMILEKILECYSGLTVETLKGVIQDLENLRNRKNGYASATGSTSTEALFWLPNGEGPTVTVSSQLQRDGSFCFHYVGDLVADRVLPKPPCVPHLIDSQSNYSQRIHYAAQRYIDCLRHRVDPGQYILPLIGSKKTCGRKNQPKTRRRNQPKTTNDNNLGDFSHLELLIYIFQHSDLPTRIDICRLLLQQRASSLLVFPLNIPTSHNQTSHEHYATELWHCTDALGFVNVPIENERNVCIAEDKSLLRLVFISDKDVNKSNSANLATRVVQSELVSRQNHCGMGQFIQEMLLNDPVIEVAIGFIPGEDSKLAACIVLHVTGPYETLLDFIAATADVVILELEQDESRSPNWPRLKGLEKKLKKVIQWKETAVDDQDTWYDEEEEEDEEFNAIIQGPESYLVKEIKAELPKNRQIKTKIRSGLGEECAKWFHPHKLNNSENMEDVLNNSVLMDIRKHLKLQKSLEIEAQAFFESLRVRDNPKQKYYCESKIVKERHQRKLMAKDVIQMPILQRFRHFLSQSKDDTRIIQIMSLERALRREIQPILAEFSRIVDSTYKSYNENRNNEEKRKKCWKGYIEAKQEYVDKSVGLEHLWRELSLIFEVDPEGQNHLAELAARYLMDGFPLEIFDGDAGVYRKTWVSRVLMELNKHTTKDGKPARFFVLSVLGLQSSGKSTMLNLMFGTRLQTSAGRCTRGVYMQLVPSNREEYDYVILIDTEGLRSNEFEGLDEAEARDNRLGTFGLLPADASILMVTNEDDRGLKEVLPMVLLAFSNSSVAEKSGGRMKTKLFFVYRSVDTNDKSKLTMNKQKLHQHLRDAAEEVSRMPGNNLCDIFSELRLDDDESKSDIRCMGNLKRGGMPPGDTPEWSYGEAVINLREHIHQRVVTDGVDTNGRRWEATNLAAWGDHLELVWKCICTADFELNFRNCVEYNAYMELQKELQLPRSRVNQRYSEVFIELETEIRNIQNDKESAKKDSWRDSTEQHTGTANTEDKDFLSELDIKMEEVIHRETECVKKLLEEKKWNKWRLEKLEEWQSSCRATNRLYHRRVEDLVSGVLKFEKIVAGSQSSFKAKIVKLMDSGDWQKVSTTQEMTQEQKEHLFHEMFQKKLEELKNKHPRIADEVSSRVTRQYSEFGIAKELDLNKPSNFKVVVDTVAMELQKVTDTFKGEKKQQKQELVQNLNKIVDSYLDSYLDTARQYSDVVVSHVIRETREAIDQVNCTREEKEQYHSFVKDKLIRRMEDIQNAWDEMHNVAAKFMTKREQLLRFFLDKAEGLKATHLLINDLQRILEDELEVAFKRSLIQVVASEMGTKEWVMHWQVLRNLLDYHLISLLDTNQIEKAIDYVYNESDHFKTVVDGFIQHAITREGVASKEWAALLRKVDSCIPESPEPKIKVFLLDLKGSLTKQVDPELADKVTSPINCGDTMLELDMGIYEERVKVLRQNLKMMEPPIIDLKIMSELVQGVKDKMETVTGNEHCKPRCEANCPRCGSACFHKKGHNFDCATSRHDCIHQPIGLHGIKMIGSHELVEVNCVEAVQMKYSIICEGCKRNVPFEDFEVEYKDWRKPENDVLDSSIQVREYIFFNHQNELLDFFSSHKK